MELTKAARETKFKFADQCAMNFVLGMEKYKFLWKKLDYVYNYCVGTSFNGLYSRKNAKIIHHTGGIKKPYKLKYIN